MRAGDRWPYEDGSLDVVVSNQVLEHVRNLGFVFAEVSRVLRDGGFSVHVFPLRSYLFETHLRLPLSHRFGDHDALRAFISTLSRLGLGKHKTIGGAVDEYAEAHADYQWFLTSYHSRREITDAAKRAGLRASYRYTPDMYANRLRSVPRSSYVRQRSPLLDAAITRVLQYVSSVSLFLEKTNRYCQPGIGHG